MLTSVRLRRTLWEEFIEMAEAIKIIKPGTKAKTVIGGIDCFITGVKICDDKGFVIYEISYFNQDGYRQLWVDEYEIETDKPDKMKIGFKC